LACAGIALLFCYSNVMLALIDKWATHPLYSYGFAVPLISAYIVWTRNHVLREMAANPDHRIGAPLIVLGLGLLVIGHVGALASLQQFSLIITLSGLIAFFVGRQILRSVWFPVAYLLLMLPVWEQPIRGLQVPSQLLSARIAVELLHGFGVPAARDATLILLPNVTLQVLQECSGVNQLIVVFAMAVPAAYLFLSGVWRRGALVAIAIVVAYLSNGFRIALIGLMAQHGIREAADAHGPVHLIQGLIVSGLGYCVIGACLSLLAHGAHSRDAAALVRVIAPPAPGKNRVGVERAVLLLLVITGGCQLLFTPVDVRLRKDLRALPTVIGDWTAEPSSAPGLTMRGVDDQVSRVYRNSAGDRLELYVGYHRYQIEGKEFGVEANRVAHEAGVAGDDGDAPSTAAARAGTTHTAQTVIWYDVNGRVLSNGYLARAYSIWDAITTRRTNAAIVIVRWNAPNDRRDSGRTPVQTQFVDALVPVLRQYFPPPDRSPHTTHVRVAP
jgi:EpsI family protein